MKIFPQYFHYNPRYSTLLRIKKASYFETYGRPSGSSLFVKKRKPKGDHHALMPLLSPRKGKFSIIPTFQKILHKKRRLVACFACISKFRSQTSTGTPTLNPAISGCLCTVTKFTSKETTQAIAPIYLHQWAGNSSAHSYNMRARIWVRVPDQ